MSIVCLYVDDLIYSKNYSAMFDKFKHSIMYEFEMSNLELMRYFLGTQVMHANVSIFISQKKYVQEILDRFQMQNCNPMDTPTEVGLKLIKDPKGRKVDTTSSWKLNVLDSHNA